MPDGQQNSSLSAPESAEAPKYIVPGLQRGLEILRTFSRDRHSIGAPELARELNIPRSTVFRLIQTLEYMGFLEKLENGSEYRLSVGVLSLGFEFIASLEVTDLARPLLEKLRDETGYSVHLAIRDGGDVIFVIKAKAESAFASSINIGTRLPAHGTVLGRVILADLSDQELDEVYSQPTLPKFSPQTPQNLDDLKALLRQDRKRGYARSASFFETGIASVAAPVRDQSGRVIASINITFQDGMVAEDDIETNLVNALVKTAETLSGRLNYRARDVFPVGGGNREN